VTTLAYIIPVLVFGATLLLVLGVAWYVSYLKSHRDLLKKIEEEGQTRSVASEDLSLSGRIKQIYLSLTRGLGSLAKPKEEERISRVKRKILQAGLSRFRNVIPVYYGTKALFTFLFPAVFIVFKFSLFRSIPYAQFLFIVVVLALIGFYIPDLWLRIKVAHRKDQIIQGFPDALDLLVVCSEAGMGLDAAMNRVGEEMKLRNAPLSEEMRILSLELRAGKPRRDALRSLAMRTDSEDIQSFAALLIQTDKFGTSLAQALSVQADSMRTKRTQRLEEIAAKLPVKLIFPTILFIFPSLFLVLMGPVLIQAWRMWRGY
jgi:tight adherence protein C